MISRVAQLAYNGFAASPRSAPAAPVGDRFERRGVEDMSVSQALQQLARGADRKTIALHHDLRQYMRAFASSRFEVKRALGFGADAVALELSGDRVLKIMKEPLAPDHGRRTFDCPALEQGTLSFRSLLNGCRRVDVHYVIQPKVEMLREWDDDGQRPLESMQAGSEFLHTVTEAGCEVVDRNPYLNSHPADDLIPQIGRWQGKLVLVDYRAVDRRS